MPPYLALRAVSLAGGLLGKISGKTTVILPWKQSSALDILSRFLELILQVVI